MKISLCKHNKSVKHTKEFLERNLRKMKIETVDCIGKCSECKKGVIAKLDGKILTGKDEYAVFKEIKKVLTKTDNTKYLVENYDSNLDEKKESKKEAKKDSKEGKKSNKKERLNAVVRKEDNEINVIIEDENIYNDDLTINIIFQGEVEKVISFDLNFSEEKENPEDSIFTVASSNDYVIDGENEVLKREEMEETSLEGKDDSIKDLEEEKSSKKDGKKGDKKKSKK